MLYEKGVITWMVSGERQVLTESLHTLPKVHKSLISLNSTGWLGTWTIIARRLLQSSMCIMSPLTKGPSIGGKNSPNKTL